MNKFLKNLKIRQKLLLSFGVVLVMFVITTYVGIAALISARNQVETFHDHAFVMSNTTYEMRANLQRLAKCVCEAIMSDDTNDSRAYLNEATEQLTKLKEGFAYIEANATTNEFLTMSAEAKGYMEQSISVREELFGLAEKGLIEKATDLYFESYEPILLKVQELIIEMDSYSEDYAAEIYNSVVRSVQLSTFILLFIAAAAMVVAVGICMMLSKMITEPIRQVVDAANQMSLGNMHKADELAYKADDELGELADSMRFVMNTLSAYIDEISDTLRVIAKGDLTKHGDEITDFLGDFSDIKTSLLTILKNFNSTLTDINNASEQVDLGSDQVAMGAQTLSQGATEQASSTEELSATVNEINAHVKESNEFAAQASAQMQDATQLMRSCTEEMNEMLSAMDDISHTSEEIGKIIKTIEDIAFQTNILALNAAVEAARAGSAGKGFAVVADEVRNLAAKSAEASKNTSTLIEASMAAVVKGAKLAEGTASQLKAVAENSEATTKMVLKISENAETQADAIQQVATGLEQISAVVQTNSATAEESAAASEELAGQAAVLKERIHRFRLFENSPASTGFDSFEAPSYTQERVSSGSKNKY